MPEFVYIPIYYICAYTECHKFNWKRIQLVTGGGCGNVEGSLLRRCCSGCGSGSGSGSGLIWPQLGLVRVQWATLDAIGIRIVIANRFSEIQFQLQKKSLEKTMLPLGPTWMWKICDGRLCRYPANSCRTFTCGTSVQFAPFTGYACVSISMNYRLTHRTTDGTGPHVSNTNVSLHKSITRNIFCAFKAQLMARGKGYGDTGAVIEKVSGEKLFYFDFADAQQINWSLP